MYQNTIIYKYMSIYIHDIYLYIYIACRRVSRRQGVHGPAGQRHGARRGRGVLQCGHMRPEHGGLQVLPSLHRDCLREK